LRRAGIDHPSSCSAALRAGVAPRPRRAEGAAIDPPAQPHPDGAHFAGVPGEVGLTGNPYFTMAVLVFERRPVALDEIELFDESVRPSRWALPRSTAFASPPAP